MATGPNDPLLPDQDELPPHEDLFTPLPPPRLPDWLSTVLFALVVLLVGVISDTLGQRHEAFWATFGFSDILTTIIAAALFYAVLRQQAQRRKEIRRRLELIGEMNHLVRNAMEVINLSTFATHNQEHVDTIAESLHRIDAALKEILPKL
jgi:muconolactone delta-isomerase